MKKISAIVVGLIAITVMSGCKDNPKRREIKKLEAIEYDCRKHDKDKVCAVPWKDKIVLYCYNGKIPRVVRDRDQCK